MGPRGSGLAAHVDPDAKWRAPALFLRSTACTAPEERRGCRFFIGTTKDGGEVVEVPTDPMTTERLLIADFSPASALHWVESAPGISPPLLPPPHPLPRPLSGLLRDPSEGCSY